jgi:hypothetical protein
MGPVWTDPLPSSAGFDGASTCAPPRRPLEDSVNNDLFFIGLTIVVFAVLYLIVKGVEHFER